MARMLHTAAHIHGDHEIDVRYIAVIEEAVLIHRLDLINDQTSDMSAICYKAARFLPGLAVIGRAFAVIKVAKQHIRLLLR